MEINVTTGSVIKNITIAIDIELNFTDISFLKGDLENVLHKIATGHECVQVADETPILIQILNTIYKEINFNLE